MPEEQLPLISNLYNPSYLDSDYVISESNCYAYNALINNQCLSYCAIIYGSAGSGKTHLSHIWKRKFRADNLNIFDSNQLMFKSGLIEDIDKKIKNIDDEISLFHSYNNAVENRHHLLMTSTLNPYELQLLLPDLQSRIKATEVFKLENPDEELLRIIIIKEFHVRALRLDIRIINFIILNLRREVSHIIKFINFIDKESIKQQKSITLPFVSNLLKCFDDEGLYQC